MAEADRELETYETLATTYHLPINLWSATTKRAMRAFVRGDLGESERFMERARAIGQRSTPEVSRLTHLIQLFFIQREQDRLHEVEAMLTAEAESNPTEAFWPCLLAVLYADRGDAEHASRLLTELLDAETPIPRDSFWLASMVLIADGCAALHDVRHATQVLEVFAPARGSIRLSRQPRHFSGAGFPLPWASIGHVGPMGRCGAVFCDRAPARTPNRRPRQPVKRGWGEADSSHAAARRTPGRGRTIAWIGGSRHSGQVAARSPAVSTNHIDTVGSLTRYRGGDHGHPNRRRHREQHLTRRSSNGTGILRLQRTRPLSGLDACLSERSAQRVRGCQGRRHR